MSVFTLFVELSKQSQGAENKAIWLTEDKTVTLYLQKKFANPLLGDSG